MPRPVLRCVRCDFGCFGRGSTETTDGDERLSHDEHEDERDGERSDQRGAAIVTHGGTTTSEVASA